MHRKRKSANLPHGPNTEPELKLRSEATEGSGSGLTKCNIPVDYSDKYPT